MSGSALVLRADALRLPLPDESVDLIVTSPPYFALRSYRDGGEHYTNQLGSEPTPQAFLEALWAVMHECWRVLKPTGSCFVNLGDKRSGSGGHNNAGIACTSGSPKGSTLDGRLQQVSNRATRRNAPDRYNQAAFGRAKSKMLLPHRFAIGCEDGLASGQCGRCPHLETSHQWQAKGATICKECDCDGYQGKGWIMRSDIVWQKLNGLPESVTDRVRDSHEWVFAMTKQDDAYGWPDEEPDDDKEILFHFTKEGRYFAAVDEVREPYDGTPQRRLSTKQANAYRAGQGAGASEGNYLLARKWDEPLAGANPLGKLPGSVWPLASEPLIISDEVKAHYDLPDHFAAFPTELVRRVILGWSPSGVCVECGEGRRPVVAKTRELEAGRRVKGLGKTFDPANVSHHPGDDPEPASGLHCTSEATITGYSCPCGVPAPPTRPSVVLDVFGGTGTTAGVARALGRIGVSIDLSSDYSRLADWRIHRSGHFAKVNQRTHRENQQDLFGMPA